MKGKATSFFWCPFHPFSGVFILQGRLLDIRKNLDSKLEKLLKKFSEIGNIRCISNTTEIMWKEEEMRGERRNRDSY